MRLHPSRVRATSPVAMRSMMSPRTVASVIVASPAAARVSRPDSTKPDCTTGSQSRTARREPFLRRARPAQHATGRREPVVLHRLLALEERPRLPQVTEYSSPGRAIHPVGTALLPASLLQRLRHQLVPPS